MRKPIRCRGATAALAVLASLLGAGALVPALVAEAEAGTYNVVACDEAGGPVNSWYGSVSHPNMHAYVECPSYGDRLRGMGARPKVLAGGRVPYEAKGNLTFYAPPGASLHSAHMQVEAFRSGAGGANPADWRVGMHANNTGWVVGCGTGQTQVNSGDCNIFSDFNDTLRSYDLRGSGYVSLEAKCANRSGCALDATTSAEMGRRRAHAAAYRATVTVQDHTAPAVFNLGGAFARDGWHRGVVDVYSEASDNVGIKHGFTFVDGALKERTDHGCDWTRALPCGVHLGAHHFIDTRTLSDGPHRFDVAHTDAAYNNGTAARTVYVDNTAPGRITPHVVGGSDWRRHNDFTIRWTNPPAQSAPVAGVRWELCRGACDLDPNRGHGRFAPQEVVARGYQPGQGIQELQGFSVPEPGEYKLKLWLVDSAGNENPDNASDPVTLRFDNVPPGQARPVERNGWLNAREAREYPQRIELRPGARIPISGVKGYSVTTDRSEPDATIDSEGPTYVINDLREGTTTVKARAISGSLVPSDEVGSTEVRVDKTPPQADVEGAPDPQVWQRHAVSVRVTGADQDHLSGMAPAPEGEPLDKGAYVAYRLNGGEERRVRGDRAEIRVEDDGLHTLIYKAVDLAGNDSPERTVTFRIDRTPPETVLFEEQDPGDPRRITVAVGDRTSGVGTGQVYMRRAGSEAWRPVESRLEGDRLVAYVDDEQLEAGQSYEFLAVVTDRAGNERRSSQRRDGRPVVLSSHSFRQETAVSATLAGAVREKCRTVKRTVRRGGRRRVVRRRVCRRVGSSGGSSLVVPFGAGASVEGQVRTVHGAALANAPISVYARVGSGPYQRVGTAHGDGVGRFLYTAAAGPSRMLLFRFEGSATQRPSSAQVALGVEGATTLRASRRRALNGQSVVFSGSLQGGPLPDAGTDMIDMQAFARGGWQTFSTAAVDAYGGWKVRYRFRATRGRRTYRFRARVRGGAGYPYEPGFSPQTTVRVRGP